MSVEKKEDAISADSLVFRFAFHPLSRLVRHAGPLSINPASLGCIEKPLSATIIDLPSRDRVILMQPGGYRDALILWWFGSDNLRYDRCLGCDSVVIYRKS